MTKSIKELKELANTIQPRSEVLADTLRETLLGILEHIEHIEKQICSKVR